MKKSDAHVVHNILVQMRVNTRTPEPTDPLDEEQVENLKTLFKDLATYLLATARPERAENKVFYCAAPSIYQTKA
jgi:hypothetical protein